MKYLVSVEESITLLVPVEADSPEEAEAKAVAIVQEDDTKLEIDDMHTKAVWTEQENQA